MSLIKHKNQKGFTLLEIMVTVAIVGILAAIAIPIYNNYITKVRIAEALTHGRVYAGKVTIDREDSVDPPENLEYSEIELAGSQENPRVRIKLKKTIDSTVLMDPDEWAGGKVIVLSEQSSDASVRWACTTNLPQALIPEGCTHEEGVGQRKLLAEWTAGNEACWSPDRVARGESGWAVGPCTQCNQKGTQRRAEKRKKPGVTKMYGAVCSGQYLDEETLAKIEAAKEEAEAANEPTEWALLSVDEKLHEDLGRYLDELTAAHVAKAEADRVAALPHGEREREEAWDLKVKIGETDGTPWDEVPAKARENDNVTVCWNSEVAQASYDEEGVGNGWVAGLNSVDDGKAGRMWTQDVVKGVADSDIRNNSRSVNKVRGMDASGRLARRGVFCVPRAGPWGML